MCNQSGGERSGSQLYLVDEGFVMWIRMGKRGQGCKIKVMHSKFCYLSRFPSIELKQIRPIDHDFLKVIFGSFPHGCLFLIREHVQYNFLIVMHLYYAQYIIHREFKQNISNILFTVIIISLHTFLCFYFLFTQIFTKL